MNPGVPSRRWPATVPVLLQSLLWMALTFAFAALLTIASPMSWSNALYFSCLNWMPWVFLAPVVFWFAVRFPFERGHLVRSIPAHGLGCLICVAATVWLATYFGYLGRPMRLESHPPAATVDRGPVDHDGAHRGFYAGRDDSWRTPGSPRLERPDRFTRGEFRDSLLRRRSFWWPFLGASLLRAPFDVAIYLIVVVAAHAIAFYRRAQDRERHAIALTAGLNRAKLDALRLQLQPHFLFNTLNAISTLVHRDSAAADELIGDLSDLLRISLQTTEHEVPLARELELLDSYLAIEKTRFGERLQIVREIEPATLPALVPTFLLQPLVENAVRHGLEPRLAPGTITIRAQRVGDRVHLSVRDNGVGLSATARPNDRPGIGIKNTEARLQALHGEAAKLTLLAPETGGVEVQIILPFATVRRSDAPTLGGT